MVTALTIIRSNEGLSPQRGVATSGLSQVYNIDPKQLFQVDADVEPTQPRPLSSAEPGGNPYTLPKPHRTTFTPVPKDVRGSARQVGGESPQMDDAAAAGQGGESRSGDIARKR